MAQSSMNDILLRHLPSTVSRRRLDPPEVFPCEESANARRRVSLAVGERSRECEVVQASMR